MDEEIFFGLAELETRQGRDAIDIGACKALGHAKCYHAGMRRAAVAGTWYPADPQALARDVDRYLSAAGEVPATDQIAVIAPHAGLRYSGPVAAYAYAALRHAVVNTAVLVGPSHYLAFEGVAIYERGAFETPFGPVEIDEECAAALMDASPRIKPNPDAHAREHSLEMQLPFLQRVLPGVKIVPLVMGRQDRDTAFELGDALASVAGRRLAVLVASTDLSHYHPSDVAATLDARVIDRVSRLDHDGLMTILEKFPHHACGGGPTVSVMRAAQALGATRARVLKYADSGDVSGDKDAVVGYLAAAFGSSPDAG
jgi:MEMO1 family protein